MNKALFIHTRRYDKEHVRCQLPSLRQVLDGTPVRSLVLCVASILPPSTNAAPASNVRGEPEPPGPPKPTAVGPQLLLTDGWYSIAADMDAPLFAQLQRGRIAPGGCCASPEKRLMPDSLSARLSLLK